MSTPRFQSVEEYLASLDPTKASTLRAVIDLVLDGFPELDAKISWNVPQIHRRGEYVFGVSALKSHLALAPWSTRVMEDFTPRLEKDHLVVRKNLVQVPIDWQVDAELIEDLVRARLTELDESPST